VIDFAPEGFACRIRVPLNTIRPNRYDKLSASFVPSSTASREAVPN
jgi:hypothetical protein